MTTNEIIATVRRKILETNSDIVTDAVILQYANEEYREVRKKLKMSSGIVDETIICSNGVCTLPATYGAMYSFATDASGNNYSEVSIADFEVGGYDYAFTIKEGSMIVNKTDITSIVIRYYTKAATLTALINPDIDEMFHEPIMYGAVSRSFEDLQDEELAVFYRTKADNEFDRKDKIQSSYEESNQKGGSMFVPQTLI